MPAGGIPNWGCDQSGAPDLPHRTRSAAPVPPAATLPPAPSCAATCAWHALAARPPARSTARPRLPPCPVPVAPAPECVDSRRSPDTDPAGLRLLPPRWESAGRWRPARPTGAAADRGGALAHAPSAGRVGETPVASDRLKVRQARRVDQYVRIKSRPSFQRRSRSWTRSSACRHS
jgi:hypothetical protein